jgi:UDP-N-acetylglucosamine enolpyruvyl transferase
LHHLDRGYEGFVDKLHALNADVEESIATPDEMAASV